MADRTAEPEPQHSTPRPVHLTRPQRTLVGITVAGALVIAGIGFAGSYTAVQQLATKQGFGAFAAWFPIGLDAGIVVLLALDLLLTWLRMPFPLLRPGAWLLTAATIAFNAAAAWPDPLGVGMHAVIPLLFVIAVEAARHAIGRLADITADRHVEPIPLRRWLLAPVPTFRLWRRMHLWQIRTLETAIAAEQARLVYATRMRAKHGRGWRRSAPVEDLLPLRLARHGVALGAPVPAPVAGPAERTEAPRPEDTPDAPDVEAPRTPESAPETEAPRPAPAPALERPAAPKTPRPAAKRPTTDDRAEGRRIIRALYDTLGRRPREGEMTAALKAASYAHTSRQHANKCRAEIERDEPKLLELGGSNVRAMTGT